MKKTKIKFKCCRQWEVTISSDQEFTCPYCHKRTTLKLKK